MARTHPILQNVSESFKHRLGSRLVSGQYATIFRWLPAMEGVPWAPDPERGLIYDHHGYKPLTKWDHPPSSYRWSCIIAPYKPLTNHPIYEPLTSPLMVVKDGEGMIPMKITPTCQTSRPGLGPLSTEDEEIFLTKLVC